MKRINRPWFLIILALAFFFSCSRPDEPSPSEEKDSKATQQKTSELVQPQKWWEQLPRPGYSSLEKVGEFQKWFEVYKLSEGTFAIYEPYQFQEVISYLVLGQERAVLIDTGNGIGNIKQVVEELTDLPLSVLLTHAHIDHIGSAHLFDDVAIFNHPDAIAAVRKGVPHERAVRSIDMETEYVWKPLPEAVDPETFSIHPAEPTRLLEEGEIIDLGGRILEVIHTPGHSPGSICFLDSGNRLLLTGDHFYPGPLYAQGANVDLNEYLASNEKIATRVDEYDYVLSAHNEPWVKSDIIPKVSEGFKTILAGNGEYSEDGDLRRYTFDGFDIIIRAQSLETKPMD